ncbi:hypothetical protein ABIA32_001766 [Streptacidiphilus sp. MAP12-20]|uniref:hypothetical protein n=1 Tax=Streptacidiphilus sp. MAP12-20 TaxID=3156299 RepID=UPI003516A399
MTNATDTGDAGGVALLVEETEQATRHLCAGAHLDEDFARKVIEEFEDEPHRAYAPAYGVNIELVKQHARGALTRLTERDQRLTACLMVSLVLQPAVTLVMWVALAFLAGAPTLDPRPNRIKDEATGRTSTSRTKVVVGAVARLIASVVVLIMVALFTQPLPRPWVWFPDLAPALILGIPLLVLLPWTIVWNERTIAWHTVSRELTGKGFAARPAKGRPEAPATDGNITVYSGYSPFIGSGVELDSWSTTTRLTPTRNLVGEIPAQATPWTVPTAAELVDGLLTQLTALRAETAGSLDGIEELTVSEKLFVDGTVLRQPEVERTGLTRAVLPEEQGRPSHAIDPELVRRYRGHHRGPIRHCLRSQVAAWGTDLVLSVYLQVTVSAGTLYLESTTLLLPPVKDAFRVADTVVEQPAPESSYLPAGQVGGDDSVLGAQAVAAAFQALLGAPFRVYRALRAPSRRVRRHEQLRSAIKSDLGFDYGARMSLRDLASGPNYRNYFQRVDVARISRQIHLRTLDFLATTLAERGVDVSDLLERRTAVYNSGILMTGGAMTGTIVAGEGNTVVKQAGAKPERSKKK